MGDIWGKTFTLHWSVASFIEASEADEKRRRSAKAMSVAPSLTPARAVWHARARHGDTETVCLLICATCSCLLTELRRAAVSYQLAD